MSDYDVYDQTIHRIKSYYDQKTADELFLHGGCYWLAQYLHAHMKNSFIMFNKEKEHCAVEFHNELYDITGRINPKHYRLATDRNIQYMRKNYIPKFNTEELRKYLDQEVKGDEVLIEK